MALLVVSAGLPGSGKSALARGVADALGATYLRIDTIETAIVHARIPYEDNPVGYVVAEWVAADQLAGGRSRGQLTLQGSAEATGDPGRPQPRLERGRRAPLLRNVVPCRP